MLLFVRHRGTPSSAELAAASSSDSDTASDSVVAPNSAAPATSRATVSHITVLKPTLKPDKTQRINNDACRKQQSLFSMGVTKTKTMQDGSLMVVTSDNNQFVDGAVQNMFVCKHCHFSTAHAPALTAHQKAKHPIGAHKETATAFEEVPEWERCLASTLEAVRVAERQHYIHYHDHVQCLDYTLCLVSLAEARGQHQAAFGISKSSEEWVSAERQARKTAEEAEEPDAEVEESDAEDMERPGRRGSDARTSRTFRFKKSALMKWDELCNDGVDAPQQAAAIFMGVNKSQISQWEKRRTHIFSQCKIRKAKYLSRRQPMQSKGKWTDVACDLNQWVSEMRGKGKPVSFLALKVRAKGIFQLLRPDEFQDFKGCNTWIRRFMERNRLSMRRKTNGKTKSAEERKPGIQRFHARLRLRLTNDQELTNMFDTKYGAYRPCNRYNVDQVPLPLFKPTSTVDNLGAKRVWIAGTKGDDSAKRFCTLQICVRLKNQETLADGSIKPGTKQPALTICFRGTGVRIKKSERDQYHPDVNVQFQRKAWYDEPTCLDWAIKHFSRDVKEVSGRNLLFMDNLDGHIRVPFKKALMQQCNSAPHYLTAEATSEIQVIDGGPGKEVKDEGEKILEEMLLNDEEFFKKWTGPVGLTASDKRVLITQIMGKAHERVMARLDVEKVARKTGCLMTIDGSDDSLIQPQGLEDYSFSAEDALLPCFNVKGDNNDKEDLDDVAVEENEGGMVGELEEVIADEIDAEDEEEVSDSSDEEEDVLQVRSIVSCEYVGPTIKFVCQYVGYTDEDTSLEPRTNIQPKNVLTDFIAAQEKAGLYPPAKPVPKRKLAKPPAEPLASKKSRVCPSRNVIQDGPVSELESQAIATAPLSEDVMDLCDSDVEVPKAPELICGPCDFGKPNIAECVAADLPGRICGEVGCHLRVHHLCLINCSETKGKPAFYKRFVDKYPSSAMCKRHCLLKMTITIPSNTTK